MGLGAELGFDPSIPLTVNSWRGRRGVDHGAVDAVVNGQRPVWASYRAGRTAIEARMAGVPAREIFG